MHWMLLPLRRYFDFSGRSRRMEYWMFQVFVVLVNVVLMLILLAGFPWSEFSQVNTVDIDASGQASGANEVFSGFGPLFWIGIVLVTLFGLAIFIPNIAVTVRRLHDRDLSGWWYGGLLIAGFIPLVNILVLPGYLVLLVVLFLDGTPGPNRYGADPKDPHQAEVFT